MTDETAMTAIDRAMGAAPQTSVIDRLMGVEGGEENLGYLQSIHARQKREEQEKQDASAPVKTDTLQESITRELGVPQDMLDTSGAGFGTRFNFSFSDDDEDIRDKFKKMHPQGEIYRLVYNQTGTYKDTGDEFKRRKESSVLVYREKAYDDDGNIIPITKDNPVRTIEGEGTGYADIADIAGPSLPLAGAIALPFAGPAGVVVGSILAGFGYGLGELAKHEINIFGFDSNMSQKDALIDAAREGRDMAIISAVIGGAVKVIRIAGRRAADVAMSTSSPELKAVQQRAMRFVEEQKVATLTANQVMKESAVMQRMASQGESTSTGAKHKAVEQLTDVTSVATESAIGSIEKIGRRLVAIAKNTYRSTYNTVISSLFGTRGRITLEQGGKALTEGGRAWQKSTKGKIDVAWRKVDEAAKTAKPVFSLNTQVTEGQSSVREVVADIRTFVNAELSASAAKALEVSGINVAETPLGKLKGIVDDIDNMASQQTNYEAIKQLKTRTGAVIEQWPWDQSVNASQARRLYGVLTDVLMNPTNKSAATRAFTTQVARATGVSRAYYDILDDQVIRTIIRSESPANLAADIGSPRNLTPNVRNLINEMPGNYAKKFKESVVYHDIILNPGGSAKALANWERIHPEGLDFIAPKITRAEIRAVADSMDALRNSNLHAALEADVKASQVARTILLKPGTGPMETKALAESIGAEGRELLRAGIYHDIVDRAVSSTGKYGEPLLSKVELTTAIDQYKATGAWQHILTDADRAKLRGMKAYITLIYKGASDAGVSLEAAKAITELKSPSTFISGAHKLGVNSLIANIMRRDAFTRWALRYDVGKPTVVDFSRLSKTNMLRIMGMISEALMEGMTPGQDIEPISPHLDALYEAAGNLDVQPIIDKISEFEIPQG